MAARKTRILDFYASKHWAILPETLQEMHRLYTEALERKQAGVELDVEAVAAKLGRPLDNSHAVTTRNGIAIIPVTGPIFRYANLFTEISGATSIETLATDFQQVKDDPNVKAIVLEINSPGGEADGTSELAQHIADARGAKPIIAYVANLGASAAYWIASAADEIVANKAASLGSIGVVCTVCVHKDKNHIELVSSQSPNKRPNVETEGGRSQIQSWLDALADVFINSVAQNRNMSVEDVIEKGGKGGLKVGQQAVDAGLADRTGTLEGVIAELNSTDLAMWKPKRKNLNARVVIDNTAKSDKGDLDMPDEPKDPANSGKDNPTAQADLDKSIKERVTAFFQETFGAKADAAPVKADDRVDAHSAELDTLRTRTEKAEQDAAAANARVAQLEKDARATRFTALVKDWPGESAKHVAMLELLATSQEGGEESAAFKDHITNLNAIAAQTKTAKLFEEIGSSQPVEGSVSAQVEADVQKRMAADPKLTRAIAFDQARSALPYQLRQEYDNEQRRAVN